MKQIIYSNTDSTWPGIEIDYHKKVELFIDSFLNLDINKKTFKILYLKEAEIISKFKKHAIDNHQYFDAIITLDEEILKNYKKAYFLPFGTSWIKDFQYKEKIFQISHLTGHKEITEGHLLRKKIHYKQEKIKNPKDFYISQYGGVENFCNNKVLKDSKNPLFDSQFHICIENDRQNNYFTEKIIDCFVTKTIPIYWGCPNINNFFDINGIYIANSFDEIIEICNSINPEVYQKKQQYVELNFEKSNQYCTILDRLENIIKQILKEVK